MTATVRGGRALRPLLVAAGLVVTALAVWLAVDGVDMSKAGDALQTMELWWLAPMCVVFALAIWLRGLRWWLMYPRDQRPPLSAVTRALLIGYFFNNILPARAGEAARVIALHRATGTPRAQTIGAVVVERLFDLIGLLVVLFCAYPWLPPISWLKAAALLGAVALAVLVVLVVAIVRWDERAIRVLLAPLRRLPIKGLEQHVEPAVANVTRGLVTLRDPRLAVQAMLTTIASWIVLGTSYWILMPAFGLDLPIAAGMLVCVAINLSLVLPSSPAAFGVFEAATIVALRAFDVPQAEALSYALVLHLVNLVPFLVIGAALLGPSALRRRTRQETA